MSWFEILGAVFSSISILLLPRVCLCETSGVVLRAAACRNLADSGGCKLSPPLLLNNKITVPATKHPSPDSVATLQLKPKPRL